MVIDNMRQNMDLCFSSIINEAATNLNSINGEMKLPRLSARQTQRCNVSTDSPEDCYRVVIVCLKIHFS